MLLLSACGNDDPDSSAGPIKEGTSWDKIIEAAEKEGAVTIYSSQAPARLAELKKRFEAAYDIELIPVRSLDNQTIPRVETEVTTGNATADVISVQTEEWVKANAAGDWFTAPIGPGFDEPDFNKEANIRYEKAFIHGASVTPFGWNTGSVPGGIKNYAGFLAPELRGGKIGVISPLAPAVVGYYNALEKQYGADFLDRLAAQKPKIYESVTTLSQAVGSKEVAAGIFAGADAIIGLKDSGAPVDWARADPPLSAKFFSVIPSKAPHPNAAQLLANFMVTMDGQEALQTNAASALPGVKGSVAQTAELPDRDLADTTPEKVKAFQNRWDQLFK